MPISSQLWVPLAIALAKVFSFHPQGSVSYLLSKHKHNSSAQPHCWQCLAQAHSRSPMSVKNHSLDLRQNPCRPCKTPEPSHLAPVSVEPPDPAQPSASYTKAMRTLCRAPNILHGSHFHIFLHDFPSI